MCYRDFILVLSSPVSVVSFFGVAAKVGNSNHNNTSQNEKAGGTICLDCIGLNGLQQFC